MNIRNINCNINIISNSKNHSSNCSLTTTGDTTDQENNSSKATCGSGTTGGNGTLWSLGDSNVCFCAEDIALDVNELLVGLGVMMSGNNKNSNNNSSSSNNNNNGDVTSNNNGYNNASYNRSRNTPNNSNGTTTTSGLVKGVGQAFYDTVVGNTTITPTTNTTTLMPLLLSPNSSGGIINWQQLTVRKYTLPDKSVASQVLMYRQLLHTKCRPGLRLSRDYQGTQAQKAVKHMPWWEKGILRTKKMIISYDNLILRLWIAGVVLPLYHSSNSVHNNNNLEQPQQQPQHDNDDDDDDDDDEDKEENERLLLLYRNHVNNNSNGSKASPQKQRQQQQQQQQKAPIPHPYWVKKLGFQQHDPVTDFRSGGVLSLTMLVHIVETCPAIYKRFQYPPVGVLPFGITCINITDMIAKFCMLSKSIDKMDALLSQKPFWKMFLDPNAILVLQELSLHMLCNVVEEMQQLKLCQHHHQQQAQQPNNANNNHLSDSYNPHYNYSQQNQNPRGVGVTVFDFSNILEITEKRVRDDLLGAGPKSVPELRGICKRLDAQFSKNLERKLQDCKQQFEAAAAARQPPQPPQQQQQQTPTTTITPAMVDTASSIQATAIDLATTTATSASNMASSVFTKLQESTNTLATTAAAAAAATATTATTTDIVNSDNDIDNDATNTTKSTRIEKGGRTKMSGFETTKTTDSGEQERRQLEEQDQQPITTSTEVRTSINDNDNDHDDKEEEEEWAGVSKQKAMPSQHCNTMQQ